MANLKFLENVVHKGILLDKGMIVSDESTELASVARGLIDRGLAEVTKEAATHSTVLVDGAAKAVKIAEADDGQAPNVNSDEAAKAEAKANQVAPDSQTQKALEDQAGQEAQVRTVKPTPEQVAATAAQVS